MEVFSKYYKMEANRRNVVYSPIPSYPEDDDSVFTEVNGVQRNIRPGEFVRACGTFETTAAKVAKYKNFTTVVPFWLESKKQINPKDVTDALWIVSRQVPHLQLCIAKHRGKLWFKRIMKLEIDFEISTKNVMDVIYEMFDTSFDLRNGPLWKVRLIFNNEKSENENFSAIFVFVTLHSINDGVTNMKIAREFVKAMNQLSAGQVVTPTFSPIIPTIDKMARAEANTLSVYKKACRKFYQTIIKNFNHETSFSGSLPFPKTLEAKTKVLIDDFSQNESEIIVKMCKKEKVTINTFIITIANFALMTIAQIKSESPLGKRKIVVCQNVNVRRHFEPQYSDVTGYHVSLIDHELQLSLSDVNNFWDVATKAQLKLKESLDVEKRHLDTIPVYHLTRMFYPINDYLTRKGYKNKTLVHYVTSNMGNLKNFLPESAEDDNIKITYLIRACSLQLTGSLFMLNFQTFNGKLIISMDYYTNQMKDDIAQEYFSLLCQFIRNMVNYQCLNGAPK